MRIRARAASLCVAAAVVLAALPAAAQAQAPLPVMDNTVWPSGAAAPNNPDLVSPGSCDPGDGSRTFSFAQSGPGVLGNATGTFSEQGTFTLARVGGVLRVTQLDSTFSGQSADGSVTGERHLRQSEVDRTEVTCTGTSDADRDFQIVVHRAHTDAVFTYPSGATAPEHGWAYFLVGGYSKSHGRAGWYFTQFSSDQDRDEVRYIEDNCRTTPNPDQANADGDRAGDACDWDIDADALGNESDNCPYVPNADQADRDRDGIGDLCDPVDDAADTDGDDVVDDADNCVDVPNADQADTGGSATLGDACEDRDADGVGDVVDNCVDVANVDQANIDVDALGDACDPDDDGDGVEDTADNCPVAANPTQRDSDGDGSGDACDGAFDSNDGFAGGGGKLAGNVHLSVALHSHRGALHGSGHLSDGTTVVRLLDVTGMRSDGDRVVAIGHASVDGGGAVGYRVEIVDEPDTFALEIGDRRWAGTLTHGNVVVR